ncbi:MAG: NAD-dependent epimerase/dehydratase family protein [Candidatus Lokiarchaeota archaeon]|nr:NAD-dependent epimerase/dehydratase family protein [Candidatus Lokiarchaeota archaeon]
MRRILVIGAAGQIGSELVPALRKKYGNENVIATGRKTPLPDVIKETGPVIYLDAIDKERLAQALFEYDINTIFHMASILSATGEKMPQIAWDININGLINVLEAGRSYNVDRIIWPSSIAAFGPTTPRDNTPNTTILQPTTIYGISKVAGELLAEYYYKKYKLDVRSMRLPGIISSETLPGGGTTDYAVEIFYEAIKHKNYTCFLREDTILPMMYQPDCLKCMIDLLEADNSRLKRRVYNVTGMSFSAGEIASEIKKYIPEFSIEYKPDFRQEIADSWPRSIDDSLARQEWDWNPSYDLISMTKDMIQTLSKRLK